MSKVLKDSTLFLMANLANRGVSFLMIPLYTRLLSPSEYGIIELADLTINLITLTLGVQAMANAFVKVYFELPAGAQREQAASTSLFLVGGLALIISLIGVACSAPAGRALFGSSHLALFFSIACVSIVPSVICDFAMTYERVRDRTTLFVILSVAQVIGAAALNAWLLISFKAGIWTFVLSKLSIATLLALCLVWRIRREFHFTFDVQIAWRQVRLGLPLIGAGLAMFGIMFSDRYFLQADLGPREVGLFSLAFKFGFLISILIGEPFFRAWSVRIFENARAPNFATTAQHTLTWLACALTLGALSLSLLSMSVLHVVVGPSFAGVEYLVPLIALSSTLRTLGDFFRSFLMLDDTLTFASIVPISVVAGSLASNALLIPAYGMWGAAISANVVWSLFLVVAIGLLKYRRISAPAPWRALLLIGGGAAVVAVRAALPRLGVVQDVLLDAAVIGAATALIWKSPALSEEHRAGLRAMLQSVRQRLSVSG